MSPRVILRILAAAVLCAAGAPVPALAHSYELGRIAIGHIWAPPAEAGAASAAVYGPILNRGEAPARLIEASTPVAEQARFRAENAGEVRWPEAIEFPPGRPVALAAWREHIWLSGLRRPLVEGSSFGLTLDFGDAGSITVEVVVERSAGH